MGLVFAIAYCLTSRRPFGDGNKGKACGDCDSLVRLLSRGLDFEANMLQQRACLRQVSMLRLTDPMNHPAPAAADPDPADSDILQPSADTAP